jgi:hypothetical protein
MSSSQAQDQILQQLARMQARLDEQANKIARQETELTTLRQQLQANSTAPVAVSSQVANAPTSKESIGRRKLLRGLAVGLGTFSVGALVGGTVVANSTPAAAIEADGGATGYGGTLAGGLAPLRLVPAVSGGAPASGSHQTGELYVDNSGNLFYCTVAGTPGTWLNLSIPNINFLPNAVRIAATIAPFNASKLIATGANPAIGDSSSIQLTIGGTNGIPANAKGVVGVLTNVGATSGGNLRFWTGATVPTVANLNVPGAMPSLNLTASFSTPLSGGKVYLGWGTGAIGAQCGYVVDISGYWL